MALVARRRSGAHVDLPALQEACRAFVESNEGHQVQAVLPSVWQPSAEELARFYQLFEQLERAGFVSATSAREVLESSGLPVDDLAKIWDLSDSGDDGQLDLGEFLCAMTLSARRREGHELPEALPQELDQVLRFADLEAEMQKYLAMFRQMAPAGGAMPAEQAQEILEMSELPPADLSHIWRLCGSDALDAPRFLCAMTLAGRRRQGQSLPREVPQELLAAAELAR